MVWVGSLGWLAFRRFGGGPRLLPSAQRVPPGAAFYSVTWGTRQVGMASITVDTLAPSDTSPAEVRVSERLVLMLAGTHGPVRHQLVTNAFLSTSLGLRRVESTMDGPEGKGASRVSVAGDSLLGATIDSTGGPWSSLQRIDGALLPLGALPIEIAYREHPERGATLSHLVFDPASLEYYALAATVTGDSTFIVPDSTVKVADSFVVAKTDTLRAWRVALTLRGVPTHGWFDVNGFPVKSWTAGGLTFERTAFDLANAGLKALDDSVHPPQGLPSAPPTAGPGDAALAGSSVAWRVLLPGAEYTGLQGAGPLQSFAGDTLVMNRMRFIPMADPMRPLQPLPMTDVRFAAALRNEPRLSPDDTAVTTLARRIVGAETSARIASARLIDWLHRNITLVSDSAGGPWPTAAQVLRARRGSPAGLAILFTALARRIGLPARPVAGLLLSRGQVKTHTWAEAFIGDWVPVDPAFGQFPATPAHARLVIGATSHWAEYVPLAGRLTPSAFLDGE